MKHYLKKAILMTSAGALGISSILGLAQTAQTTVTVNPRHTIGVLSGTPSTVSVDGTVSFTYQLFTAGAPLPSSPQDQIQFYDIENGGSPVAIGAPLNLSAAAGANLLPNSHINLTNNAWTTIGTTPTVNAQAANGPDGSTNTATNITFPGSGSGVQAVVTGPSYVGQQLTFSLFLESSTFGHLLLNLADGQGQNAGTGNHCGILPGWNRCSFTYTMPSGAASGFTAQLTLFSTSAQTVSIWGPQVEQAASPGPYVSTIGVAKSSTNAAGVLTGGFTWTAPSSGSHVIYAEFNKAPSTVDANFVENDSNQIAITVGKGTITSGTVTASAVSPVVYGTSVAFTAAFTPSDSNTPLSGGTVQFMDGSTPLGSPVTIGSGNTASLAALSNLAVGTHQITAVYSGDANYDTFTTPASSFVVTVVPSSALQVSITPNPSQASYGDDITFTGAVTPISGTLPTVPTGSVTITTTIGGATVTLGTVTLNSTGAYTLTVPSTSSAYTQLLTPNTYTVTATFTGTGNFQ
jgi:Big-like domain-containing protein